MEYADGKMLGEIEDGVGTITFNNPAKRNAMSIDMWLAFGEILEKMESEPSVRVVVLTGAGDKAFVSGADISQFEKHRNSADAQKEYDRVTGIGRKKMASFAKPVIARIKGFCIGGGLGIALQTDLRIASDDSQFAVPAAKLGLAYTGESLRQLVNLVGPANARMILFTGSRFNAAEALQMGLINRVVPSDDLANVVKEIAQTIAGNAPLSVAASRIAISEYLKDPDDRDLTKLDKAITTCFNSADFKEGRTAFMEKRKPQFTGV